MASVEIVGTVGAQTLKIYHTENINDTRIQTPKILCSIAQSAQALKGSSAQAFEPTYRGFKPTSQGFKLQAEVLKRQDP